MKFLKNDLLKVYLKTIFWPMLFGGIEIETMGICNRHCSFCPNSLPGVAKHGIMDSKIFKKIIDDLGDMKYNGIISLHMYGEPLLDKRLPRFVRYVKKMCPESFVKINTNGDLLTKKLFVRLARLGIDMLYISQYDGKINRNVKEVVDWVYTKKRVYRHLITVRLPDDLSDNRAGLLSGPLYRSAQVNVPCFRPLTTMIINWKGDHVLCCNDYLGVCTIGNVLDHTLAKLWYDKKISHIRKLLIRGKRESLPLCKKCNAISKTLFNDYTPEEYVHRFGLLAR